MAENSENIEARLCAYVEGDLDEQGRVEIERHLEAHPNHRRLLSELIATRDLLRFLPREQAPAELSESFNSQLERSALLDGAAGGESSLTSIHAGNFMPRFMAAAAIVILGSGLFAIVYFSLPRGESGTQLAMPTSTVSATSPADRTESASLSDLVSSPARVEDAEFRRSDTREFAAKGGWTSPEPVYLIVSADRLDAAVEEVENNLRDNSINFEQVAAAAPLPWRLQQNQVANDSARNGSQVAQLELSNALSKKQQYQQKELGSAANLAITLDASEKEEKTTERTLDEAASTTLPAESAIVYGQLSEEEKSQAPASPSVLDTEVVAINAYGVTRRQVMEIGRMLNRSSQQVEFVSEDRHLLEANAELQRMLAGRRTLTTTFADQTEWSEQKDDAFSSAAPTTAESAVASAPAAEAAPAGPVHDPVASNTVESTPAKPAAAGEPPPLSTAVSAEGSDAAANDKSKIHARDGGGPRPEPLGAGMEIFVTVDELRAPDTEPTTQVRIGEDGTVRLPMLDMPVKVNGLSREQAQTAIADAYKSAGVIDSPTVLIEPVADVGPPVQAANALATETQERVARQRATPAATAPSTQIALQPAVQPPIEPETQPSQFALDTDAEDERVDVVILVQQNIAPATTVPSEPDTDHPETQPAPVDVLPAR